MNVDRYQGYRKGALVTHKAAPNVALEIVNLWKFGQDIPQLGLTRDTIMADCRPYNTNDRTHAYALTELAILAR